MQRLLFLVPALVFAVVSTALGFSLLNAPRKMPAMLIDKAMPPFVLASLDHDSHGFSGEDLKGNVVLLNVFASWCGSCRVEHPTLMALANGGIVPIYGVNWKDRAGDGARWLRTNKSPYVRVGEDRSGRFGNDLGVTGVPETFVIDRTGRIRYRHAGPVTDEAWRDTFVPIMAWLGTKR